MKCSHRKPRTWTDTLVRPKQWIWDMRFGTWNVRSLYSSGSLKAAARELVQDIKQWQTTPKNLPRMQCARAIPVT